MSERTERIERNEKITFENYDRKIEKIEKALAAYGINGLEDLGTEDSSVQHFFIQSCANRAQIPKIIVTLPRLNI